MPLLQFSLKIIHLPHHLDLHRYRRLPSLHLSALSLSIDLLHVTFLQLLHQVLYRHRIIRQLPHEQKSDKIHTDQQSKLNPQLFLRVHLPLKQNNPQTVTTGSHSYRLYITSNHLKYSLVKLGNSRKQPHQHRKLCHSQKHEENQSGIVVLYVQCKIQKNYRKSVIDDQPIAKFSSGKLVANEPYETGSENPARCIKQHYIFVILQLLLYRVRLRSPDQIPEQFIAVCKESSQSHLDSHKGEQFCICFQCKFENIAKMKPISKQLELFSVCLSTILNILLRSLCIRGISFPICLRIELKNKIEICDRCSNYCERGQYQKKKPHWSVLKERVADRIAKQYRKGIESDGPTETQSHSLFNLIFFTQNLHQSQRTQVKQPSSNDISKEGTHLEHHHHYLHESRQLTSILNQQNPTRTCRQFLYRKVEVRRNNKRRIIEKRDNDESDHHTTPIIIPRLALWWKLEVVVVHECVLRLEHCRQDEEVGTDKNEILFQAHQLRFIIELTPSFTNNKEILTNIQYDKIRQDGSLQMFLQKNITISLPHHLPSIQTRCYQSSQPVFVALL